MQTKLLVLLATLIALLALAGCGGDDQDETNGSGPAIAEEEEFNRADVDFATEMIQHHAQALSMVDLVQGKAVSADLTSFAEQIRMAQGLEIEVMVGWLQDWFQPVPETMRDHANSHGDGGADMHADMPGMVSAEEMAALEAAQGAAFERLWLEMMIDHHEGAIEMAGNEKDNGEFVDAIELANAIIAAQEAEIEQMESMLGS